MKLPGTYATHVASSNIKKEYQVILKLISVPYIRNQKPAKSKRRGIKEFTITAEDLISLYREQEGRCVVSGVILTHHKDGHGNKEFNISIDRIDNTLGYTLDNVRLVAYRLNMMRGGLTNDMFYWWVRTINDFTCK